MDKLLAQSMQSTSDRLDSMGDRRDAQGPCGSFRISVIVPVGPDDDSWKSLLLCLAHVTGDAEICFVAPAHAPDDLARLLARHRVSALARWIVSPPGRANQMNAGARHAQGDFLWFLHADCQFRASAFDSLSAALDADPQALHYFDLAFDRSAIGRLLLNEWGVQFRSRVLRLPFGDQGLCLHRQLFAAVGPFDETVDYGEDHLLVWNCHHFGTSVRPIRATLLTSARKYHQRGWLRTTALHAWRTWRQAGPQLWRMLWSRPR